MMPWCLLALLLTAQLVASQKTCAKSNKQCDQYAPCCGVEQYCYDKAWTCLKTEECDVDASFPGACIDKPMCKSFREDFNSPTSVVNKFNYSGNPDENTFWIEFPGPEFVTVENGNMVISMKWDNKQRRAQGATVPSVRWMQYGILSARIKVPAGRGFVSSFITKSSLSDSQGDEIDFEMLGSKPYQVQTNFYWNGQLDYTKGKFFNLTEGSTTSDDYHIYTINWQPQKLSFTVDGKVLREVLPADVDDQYPRSESRIFFSLWDAGCGTAEGTKDWAGGESEWCNDESKRDQIPRMYVDWVKVDCSKEDTTPVDRYIPKFVKPPPNVQIVLPPGTGKDPRSPDVRKSAGPGTAGNAGDLIGSVASTFKRTAFAVAVGIAIVFIVVLST